MRTLSIIACCLTVGCGLCGNPVTQSPDKLPFPQEVTSQWVAAGAGATWTEEVTAAEDGIWSADQFEIQTGAPPDESLSVNGEVFDFIPGFRLDEFPANLESLAEPDQEFCLSLNLGGHDLSAADLNRLNRFQNLVALHITAGAITADEQSLQLPNLRLLSVTGKASSQFWAQAVQLPALEQVASPTLFEREELNLLVGKNLKSLSYYPGDDPDAEGFLVWLSCLKPQRNLTVPCKSLEPKLLEWLSQQTQLQALDLTYPKVTDENLMALGQLPNLTHLHLAAADFCNRQSGWAEKWESWPPPEKQPVPFTPEGFRTAFSGRKFADLLLPHYTAHESEWFAIEVEFQEPMLAMYVYRDITDDDLAILSNQLQLEELVLNCYRITDAGLVHLENLPNLKKLDLDYIENPKTTESGLAKLKEKLPDVEIWGGIPVPPSGDALSE